jgi:hypothetical protein
MAIGTRISGCAALVLATALIIPGLTSARARPCEDESCTARILVGPEPVLFVSRERFDLAERRLAVRVLVDGESLRPLADADRPGCRRHLRGPGVAATVSVCGRLARLEVRAGRTWGGTVPMEIRYRAREVPRAVKGVSADSSGSGGVAPSGSGGLGAG